MTERAWRLVRDRAEIAVLVLLLCVSLGLRVFRHDVGAGVYLLGLTTGAGLALQAIGIVVVYRANRVINFAQVEMGLLAGAVFQELVRNRLLLLGVRQVCPPCIPGPRTVGDLDRIDVPAIKGIAADPALAGLRNIPISRVPDFNDYLPKHITVDDLAVRLAPGWLVQVSYWLSMAVALAVALFLSWAVYALIIRRFDRAPKLITTVLTIGLAEVFVLLRDAFVSKVSGGGDGTGRRAVLPADAGFPFSWHVRVSPTVFGSTEIMTVIVCAVVLVGLTLFFTRNAIGVVLRGASENPDRAQTLGVNVRSVNGIVWMLAGGLSAVASILVVTGGGAGGANEIRFLAAAVMAGFVSLPLAAAAAFVVGIADQSFSWVLRGARPRRRPDRRADRRGPAEPACAADSVDTDDGGWAAAQEMRPIPPELPRSRGRDPLGEHREGARRRRRPRAAVAPVAGPDQPRVGHVDLRHHRAVAPGAHRVGRPDQPRPLRLRRGRCVVHGRLPLAVPALGRRRRDRSAGSQRSSSASRPCGSAASTSRSRRSRSPAPPPLSSCRRATSASAYPPRCRARRSSGSTSTTSGPSTTSPSCSWRRRSSPCSGCAGAGSARALMACRENEAAAQTAGINLLRARLTAFAVSGFMAGFAGGLFAFSQYGVNISNFGTDQSIKMFLMVVIGGLGSVAGPLIGAAYIGVADIVSGLAPAGSPLHRCRHRHPVALHARWSR